MASQEGTRKTYTCLCQKTNGQAVCVDVKPLGTTEGIYQNSAILVLLHDYGRFFGCMYHGHMMLWHTHCDIYDVWICEGVIYHTSDGTSSLMTTYGSPISPLIRLICPS
jgi:hypothetical protein